MVLQTRQPSCFGWNVPLHLGGWTEFRWRHTVLLLLIWWPRYQACGCYTLFTCWNICGSCHSCFIYLFFSSIFHLPHALLGAEIPFEFTFDPVAKTRLSSLFPRWEPGGWERSSASLRVTWLGPGGDSGSEPPKFNHCAVLLQCAWNHRDRLVGLYPSVTRYKCIIDNLAWVFFWYCGGLFCALQYV